MNFCCHAGINPDVELMATLPSNIRTNFRKNERMYIYVCNWVTLLYSRKLTEHYKAAIMEMEKIKIIIKWKNMYISVVFCFCFYFQVLQENEKKIILAIFPIF